jgi:hypothetical protein
MTSTRPKPHQPGTQLPCGSKVVRLLEVDVDDAGRIVRTYLTASTDGRLRPVAECVPGTVDSPNSNPHS